MLHYGQVTQVYRFGGADVFDPLSGMRYPIAFERSDVSTVQVGDLVRFATTGETPWAAVAAVIDIDDVPTEARDALSDLAESWPAQLVG